MFACSLRSFCQGLIGLSLLGPMVHAAIAPNDESVSFRRQVAPLLVTRCLGCHNDQKRESDLNFRTFALLRQGGKDLGAGIVEPGDPEASHLIAVLRPDASPRMPLKQEPLSDPEIALLSKWIEQGAKFDGPSESETPLASLVDPLAGLPRVVPRRPVRPPITALAMSADGKRLAVGRGHEVLLLDAGSGKLEATFADHEGLVQAVAFTPDGRTLVAAGGRPGQFGSIAVWDVDSGTRTKALRGHGDAILALALSPDGRVLATASYDRLVKLWDLGTGQELRTLKEHTDAVYAVAFSPDGRLLASAAGDRTVKVWEVASGRKTLSLADATGEQFAVAFSPDGATLLAAGADKMIRAWRLDGASASLERSAFAHEAPVGKLVVLPERGALASAGEDRRVKFWDLKTLEPRRASEPLGDWPLALAASADGSVIVAGLYDGSVVRLDAALNAERRLLDPDALPARGDAVDRTAAAAQATEPKKPELVRNAALGAPSPRGAVRGSTVTLALNGLGVGQATELVFSDPGLSATLKPREPFDANAIDAVVTLAPEVRQGVYRLWLRTPLGTPASQPFAVSAEAETAEVEPNDAPEQATVSPLPSTLVGAIGKPGDVDLFRLGGAAGQTLVFELQARGLGSALNGALDLIDEQGNTLASARRTDDGREAVLVYRIEQAAVLRLRVSDTDLGGSGAHFYRIRAGAVPLLRSVWPLGVPVNDADAFRTLELEGSGENLPCSRVMVAIGPGTQPGTRLEVPDRSSPGSEAWARVNSRKIVTAEGPQVAESAPNETPGEATPLASPGGFSGRIDPAGDVDHVRFEAKRGERWVVEVAGRRLGSPIDPVIEILDTEGRSIPRAVLRPVRQTTVAFRDHNSSGKAIRLTWPWTGFGQGDYVLIGSELLRLQELPRNPDDDAVFWGTGGTRLNSGDRMAFLGTTPEHHPMSQPIYGVEIHPPGSSFPPGGPRPATLVYRNDDGGPGLEKDSWILFDAPADGSYVVRIEDVRALGGPGFGYHLLVRKPRPDFRVSLATNTPNVPRGAATVVPVNLERIDGFTGPVEVKAGDLPAGIRVVPTVIETDQYTADLLFLADTEAPTMSDCRNWQIEARAVRDQAPADEARDPANRLRLSHDALVNGPAKWITVVPEPNVAIHAASDVVRIRPGQEVTVNLAIERRNGFTGRVPIDVRNLPYGVAVQNIGLNGVLVTEQASERSITLRAEPWVKPQKRPFFAVARCEAAGTEAASAPIVLEVEAGSEGDRPAP